MALTLGVFHNLIHLAFYVRHGTRHLLSQDIPERTERFRLSFHSLVSLLDKLNKLSGIDIGIARRINVGHNLWRNEGQVMSSLIRGRGIYMEGG